MKYTTLSIVISGDQPPSEFRIFTAGKVETSKGTFTFDAKAAASVMVDYKAQGVDLMVDYAHASLSPVPMDPAQAGKAAGWFCLEIRNGELWATNVRWTLPAAEALSRKEWRYMSPAFQTDDEGRIVALMNVAITNMPATKKLQPLMAAAKGTRIMADGNAKGGMTLDELLKVAKALGLDPTATSVADILAKLNGTGDPDASTDEVPPPADPAAPPEMSAVPPPPPAGGDSGPPSADDPKKKKDAQAASRVAMQLTGLADEGAAMAELARRSQVAVDLEKREAQLSADRAALEAGERRGLVGQLVKLGAEIPATAWKDEKGSIPCDRLAKEPIADLRARVTVLAAAGPRAGAPRPPPSGSNDGKTVTAGNKTVQLSASELQACTEMGCTPEAFAVLKATRESANAGGN